MKMLENDKNEYLYEEKFEADFFQKEQLDAFFEMIPNELLSSEEEKYYFKQVALGNKEAKDVIIKHNLRLVISIAKNYRNRGLELADLIQEGNIGLIKAVDNFDLNMGTRFSTYASPLIHNAIKTAINYYGRTIRIPISLKEKIIQFSKVKNNLNNTLGREATKKEIAKELGVSVGKIEDIIRASRDVISYNVKVDIDDDGDELIDLVRDENIDIEEDMIKDDLKENVNELLKVLNERERYVLIHRFGLNNIMQQTLEQIGNDLNIKRESVRQIEKNALKKLSKKRLARDNVDFLDKAIDFEKEKDFVYIYDYFAKTKKYLFHAFDYLEKKEFNYLRNIYGEYFDKKVEIIDTKEHKEIINKLNLIIEGLQNPLNVITNTLSLDKILRIETEEDLLYLIENLDENDRSLLMKKYQNGFNNAPIILDSPLENYFFKGIIKKMKKLKGDYDNIEAIQYKKD